jgi:hypothetical protein
MTELIQRKRNWAPWYGLLLALVAILSNAGFFLALPGQKAIPFLSWTLAVIALVFALKGVIRPFRQPQEYSGKISSSILGLTTVLIVALVVFGGIQSRKLPDAAEAPQPGQKAPDFTLADTNGTKVSLGQLLGNVSGRPSAVPTSAASGATTTVAPKAVLLIFYRGYW